ncbi:MAG TPA: hypothetical protein PKL44_00480 [Candidatus Dojkabacteria bacterium]|nr:hypothetical protein [Candidatus Dojkabacteria bacterium]
MLVQVTQELTDLVSFYIASFTGTFEIYLDHNVINREGVYIRFKNSTEGRDQGIPPSEFKRLLRQGILRIVTK